MTALQQAVESPRQEFFRRLNLAPGATAQIVAMRRDLLSLGDPALAAVDRDLMHLLASWFNRGFLVLRRIDWQTPAAILEKIIHTRPCTRSRAGTTCAAASIRRTGAALPSSTPRWSTSR